jgi:hypothetical protein
MSHARPQLPFDPRHVRRYVFRPFELEVVPPVRGQWPKVPGTTDELFLAQQDPGRVSRTLREVEQLPLEMECPSVLVRSREFQSRLACVRELHRQEHGGDVIPRPTWTVVRARHPYKRRGESFPVVVAMARFAVPKLALPARSGRYPTIISF